MTLVPLISFGAGQLPDVALVAEVDDFLGVVVALRARNVTGQAARFTLDRPIGDTLNVRVGPGSASVRRVLGTPLSIDLALGSMAAGANLSLAHPVP